MAGYAARTGPSEGVLTELHARSLFLEDAQGHRLVVLTLELIEIPSELRDRIVELAKQQHGIPADQLLLNVSHTHGGPMISAQTVRDWGIEAFWASKADAYVEQLLDAIDRVLGEAANRIGTARVSFSQGECGFAMNRRLPTPEGILLAPNPDGSVDHDVPVLRVTSPDGKPIATLFGYACHNTALGPVRQLHGDYAGFAQELLEREEPEGIALFLMGCGGDQNPEPRRDLDDARRNGQALARAVQQATQQPGVQLPPALQVRTESVPLPFAALPPRDDLKARSTSPDGFVARHAQSILERWPNPEDQPPDYPYPVQVALLGNQLQLIALGGEPMVDYSLRLKRELAASGRSTWVAGYSNLVHAYIPTRKVLREGGYEGTQAI
ncbi:MAG: neutral/alkaline non-lysosomal ceramidase N-terminal domain-containing protein, partial [Pirellulaceae bacterium]